MECWTPPFCGIRTSAVCLLGNQSVGSPVPRQKKRAGDGVLGCSLLQPLWDRHWGGPRRCCFSPPALGRWRGDWLVWGPQQTWWMPCEPLQACFLWGWSDCVGRTRFRCVRIGVHTLWCPLWQQWRTPLCLRVYLGQGGKLCSGHSCSWGLRATCSFAWWPSLQHSSAVLRSRLHVIHAEAECTEHFD